MDHRGKGGHAGEAQDGKRGKEEKRRECERRGRLT
jgi:hypothetical protein